jgi:hypothetical protein
MAATLSGVCAATSTPAEKQLPSPRITTTEISDLDSISARAAESSSITGISMMLSGGFLRTMCAADPLLSNESRLKSYVVCKAILFRGEGARATHQLVQKPSLSYSRIACSSAAEGSGVCLTSFANRSFHPVFAITFSMVTSGCTESRYASPVSSNRLRSDNS